jgi:hypothetical protein
MRARDGLCQIRLQWDGHKESFLGEPRSNMPGIKRRAADQITRNGNGCCAAKGYFDLSHQADNTGSE